MGYTIITSNANTFCAPCPINCGICSQNQPNICLACVFGYYLSTSGICIQCTTNCISCNNLGCLNCFIGYYLNSAKTCSQNCQAPCATCSNFNPSKCITCIAGYSLNLLSNTCVPTLNCYEPCAACPAGYSLSYGLCIQCTTPNCKTCNQGSSICATCMDGYYLNSSYICSLCPSQCSTCISATNCLTCS